MNRILCIALCVCLLCGLTIPVGVDYCRSPDINPDSTYAKSLTFGLPGTKGVNGYVGWDYYYHIGAWGGD